MRRDGRSSVRLYVQKQSRPASSRMQAVECGEMSPLLSLPTLLPKPDAHLRFDEFVTHRAPFRYRKFYAGKTSCDIFLRVPEERSLLPDFDRPSIDSPLFVIPHPLGFEIGPQTVRKTFAFRCSCGL